MSAGALVALSALFVMLWSSGWIVSLFAIDGLSAMSLLTARYLIVFVMLLLVVTVMGHWRRLSRSTIATHLFIGVLSHAAYLLAGVGSFELGVSAALVAFVTALQPMVTAALASPITGEKTTSRQWQGLLLGLCAVVILVSDGFQRGLTAYALFLPFVAVLSLSLGTLLFKRWECRSARPRSTHAPVSLLLLIHSAGALSILLPLSASHDQVHFNFTTNQWAVILWLAIVVSLGSYALLLILLRHMPSMQVASLGYLVPPAVMVQSWLLFGQTIELVEIIGLCIAGSGVYLVMKPATSRHYTPTVVQELAVSAVLSSRGRVDIEL